MTETVLLAFLTTFTSILGGDRIYQVMRQRRNGVRLVTKEDISGLREEISGLRKDVTDLTGKVQQHLGYHEGLRER